MPAPVKKGGGLGSKTVNPVPVIIIGVVVVAVFVYAMFIRPGQQAAAIAKNWSSPEEAAKRSPEGRPMIRHMRTK